MVGAPVGDLVLIAGMDQAHGFELWSTNGLAGSTHLVRDINPGRADSYPFS
jgi:ELWxxDGT repeat protein